MKIRYNVTIKAMEAANLPASLPDLDFAVINGNYASGAGIGDKVLHDRGRGDPWRRRPTAMSLR